MTEQKEETKLSVSAQQRLATLDLMTAERSGAQRILEKAHELFPVKKEMAAHPDFKGTHHITLTEGGQLQVNLWIEGRVWPIRFTGELHRPPQFYARPTA